MQEIEPEITKKGIIVWFQYPFSWKFVETCRKYRIRWDAELKKHYISFSNATLPLNSERIISNYKDLFGFYKPDVIEIFRLVMNNILKVKNNIPPILTEPLDLNDYPELFMHQRTGIQFIENTGGLCILADEQGLGKTKTVSVWLLKKKIPKTLIVTPLSARFIWRNELVSLGIPEHYVNIVENNFDGKFVIINYDKLKKYMDIILSAKFDCLVCDEAHLMKNRLSQRFKLVEKISRKCKYVIPLTATPVNNKPIEIFPLLRLIKSPLGKNVTDFADRYCDRKLVSHGFGKHYDIDGASNLDELGQKLKIYMIRRLKKDCLDLPEKIFTKYFLNFNTKEKNKYDKILDEYRTRLIRENRDTYNIHLAYLSLLRQFCSLKKSRYTEEYIKDAIESNEKIVIFSYFNETLNSLYEKYKDDSVIITGKTIKKNERERLKDEFQNNPKIKIFFGNIKAAGTALTLTAGHKVIFNDLTWNPTDHWQAEDRIHRIGSEHEANIIYPIFKDSIEEYIFNILKNKEALINTIMKGSEEHFNEESVIKELIKTFNHKNKINEA